MCRGGLNVFLEKEKKRKERSPSGVFGFVSSAPRMPKRIEHQCLSLREERRLVFSGRKRPPVGRYCKAGKEQW